MWGHSTRHAPGKESKCCTITRPNPWRRFADTPDVLPEGLAQAVTADHAGEPARRVGLAQEVTGLPPAKWSVSPLPRAEEVGARADRTPTVHRCQPDGQRGLGRGKEDDAAALDLPFHVSAPHAHPRDQAAVRPDVADPQAQERAVARRVDAAERLRHARPRGARAHRGHAPGHAVVSVP